MVNNIIVTVDEKESHAWLTREGVQAFMHCTLILAAGYDWHSVMI